MEIEHPVGKKGDGKMSAKMLCLMNAMYDTHIARRIDMLKILGFEVEAVGYERDAESGSMPNCPTTSLGYIPPQRYASRMFRLLPAVLKLRNLIRRNDIVYAFSSDLAAIAAGIGLDRPIVLDSADIKTIQTSRTWRGWAVRALDKFAVDRSDLLVLSSNAYRDYYRAWLNAKTPIVVIGNKLDGKFVEEVAFGKPWKLKPDNDANRHLIRLGWFGRLRDRWSLEVLDQVTRLNPMRFTAVIAGSIDPLMGDFGKVTAANPALAYKGEYSYPDDLSGLYSDIDIATAFYPPDPPHGWSDANRYYEACLFRKPIMARAGCTVANNVRKHGIGLVIDTEDVLKAAKSIESISETEVARWRSNISKLPMSEYAFVEEPAMLKQAIDKTIHA